MILLVDAGNSRLKWGWLKAGRYRHGGALDYEQGNARRSLAEQAWGDAAPPRAVFVASVAGPSLRRSLTAWMRHHWQLKPRFLVAEAEAQGVRNAYTRPERLGVDRWLAMIGARKRFRGHLCLVDCGTAITLDVLAKDGRHLGGLIVPGLQAMQRALAREGAALALPAEVETAVPAATEGTLFAADTENAIHLGTLYEAVALVDRVMEDVRLELGGGVRLVLTGGDAGRLQPLLANRPTRVDDLVLRGLAIMAQATLERDGETAAAVPPDEAPVTADVATRDLV